MFVAVSVFRRPPRALSAVRPAPFPPPAPLSPAPRPPPSAPHPQPRARPPWVPPCSGRFPFFFPLPSVPARWFPFFRPGAGVFRPGAGVFRPGAVFSSLGAFSFVPGRVSFVPVYRAGVLCCLSVCSVWSRRATPVKYYGGFFGAPLWTVFSLCAPGLLSLRGASAPAVVGLLSLRGASAPAVLPEVSGCVPCGLRLCSGWSPAVLPEVSGCAA